MKIPGVKSVKAFSRWVQARLLGGALILGYHRVAHVKRDEYEVCVTPDYFAEQMEALSQYTHPLRLAELVQCLRLGSLPPKSVAVTFDDGYADNLYEAKPVLERYDIPATVFVCTGYQGREFWWDELADMILQTRVLPQKLAFKAEHTNFSFDLENENVLSNESLAGYREWSAYGNSNGLRSQLYIELWRLLSPLRFEQQQDIIYRSC